MKTIRSASPRRGTAFLIRKVLLLLVLFLQLVSGFHHFYISKKPCSVAKLPFLFPNANPNYDDERRNGCCRLRDHATIMKPTSRRSGSSCLQFAVSGGGNIGALAASIFRTTGSVPVLEAFGINAILFASLSSKLSSMLTPAGFVHALALGTSLWATLGWRGWLYCVMYLFLGQAVTKIRFAEKEKAGLAEGRGGRRGPENVWGSAATGLICAVCSVWGSLPSSLGISSGLLLLGYVASLATKLSDTFASEIGKAYGKTTFLITTLESVEPGTEGAISLEGTAASIVGGFLLSVVGYLLGLIPTLPAVLISTVAAFIATNIESILGATLQEKEGLQWMTNEVVNFINTLIGAILAMIGGAVFLSI